MMRIISAVLFFVLLACQPKEFEYKVLQGNAQGTTYSITYGPFFKQDISKQIDSLFKVIDKSMSLWDSTSLISKVNNNEYYESIDSHFLKVFEASKIVNQKSNGYFDVSIGPLVKAWGFSGRKGLPIPNDKQVDSLKKLIGSGKIKRIHLKIVKVDKRNQLDFNAIAQGYTVDVISDFLKEKGCNDYLVEIGGEVRAKGKNKEGKIWRVGIEKPQEERALEVIVKLEDRALATSGSYRKFFEKDGKKFSHAIDPMTGYPVTHNLLSISVLAKDCMSADAYATSFLVMGLEKAKILAEKEGLDFFAIFEEKGKIKTFATFGFSKSIVK